MVRDDTITAGRGLVCYGKRWQSYLDLEKVLRRPIDLVKALRPGGLDRGLHI